MPRKKEKKKSSSFNPVEVVQPHEYTCCLCGKTYIGWSNNPYPLSTKEGDECCNECNYTKVIPARMEQMIKEYEKEHGYDKSTV